jgi:hypothetical protein
LDAPFKFPGMPPFLSQAAQVAGAAREAVGKAGVLMPVRIGGDLVSQAVGHARKGNLANALKALKAAEAQLKIVEVAGRALDDAISRVASYVESLQAPRSPVAQAAAPAPNFVPEDETETPPEELPVDEPEPEPEPEPSKAQRIAAAIHQRTVVQGMGLPEALAEVKAEFEGQPQAEPAPKPSRRNRKAD